MSELLNCRCGGRAEIVYRECDYNCMYEEVYIECSNCDIRTGGDSYNIKYGDYNRVKAEQVSVWNSVMQQE